MGLAAKGTAHTWTPTDAQTSIPPLGVAQACTAYLCSPLAIFLEAPGSPRAWLALANQCCSNQPKLLEARGHKEVPSPSQAYWTSTLETPQPGTTSEHGDPEACRWLQEGLELRWV